MKLFALEYKVPIIGLPLQLFITYNITYVVAIVRVYILVILPLTSAWTTTLKSFVFRVVANNAAFGAGDARHRASCPKEIPKRVFQ